ncbi:MAG: hypothetical protein HOE90_04430 [Bacteriovoracaceae bacterium]|jgi:glutathione synthase/RimK-type ligase-like ATP-grasp enzyme|nr:hypothetical protein [Bacteriovoracaceae bacterium]
MKLAFLICSDLSGFFVDDNLAITLLKERGIAVDPVVWDAPDTNWGNYDAVIIRSTWDYTKKIHEFIKVLKTIHNSGVKLLNELETVAWNYDKNYLSELGEKGVSVIPTRFDLTLDRLGEAFDIFECQKIIVKPTIGAGSDKTYPLEVAQVEQMMPQMAFDFENTPFMVQPFIEEVITVGEYSAHFFDCNFSHAITKTPKKGDYRVQEEHGGILEAVVATKELTQLSKKAIECAPGSPLYARVDWLYKNDQWLLMELELIEPALYLSLHPEAPANFVQALLKRVKL